MDRDAYLRMAAHEHKHWWFVGRRAYLDAVLRSLRLASDCSMVEAGCGTGGNLYVLSGHGRLVAFEPDDLAIRLARQKHRDVTIQYGRLPDQVPYPPGAFHLVAALDVLEHVDDDRSALSTLVELARPGGFVLLTVPAHQFLWGKHDMRLHHRRRYTRSDIESLVGSVAAEKLRFEAFNTILAPVALVYRLIENVTGLSVGDQEQMPTTLVNAVLAYLFSLERHLAGRIPPPTGPLLLGGTAET